MRLWNFLRFVLCCVCQSSTYSDAALKSERENGDIHQEVLHRFLKRHPVQSDPDSCQKNYLVPPTVGVWRYRIDKPGMKAGINDRISIMCQLLDLAAATCSKLMFPIPCRSLTDLHNARKAYGSSLSCDHKWDHYVRFSHPWLLLESNSTESSADLKYDYIDISDFYKWKVGRKVISKLPKKTVIANSTLYQDTFADSIIMNNANGVEFYSLHIRRTDVKKLCDTRIPVVMRRVNDILKGIKGSPSLLFYMTDETKLSYNAKLMKELETIPQIQKVLHLDQIIEKMLQNEEKVDNYFAFQIAKAVRERSKIFIEMTHQSRCPKAYYFYNTS